MVGIPGKRAFGPLLALSALIAVPALAEPHGYPTGKDWEKRDSSLKYFYANSQEHVVVIGDFRRHGRPGRHSRHRRRVIGGVPVVRSLSRALRIARPGGKIHVLSHVKGRPVTIASESVRITKPVHIRGARWDVGDRTSAKNFPENLASSDTYLTPGHKPVCMSIDVAEPRRSRRSKKKRRWRGGGKEARTALVILEHLRFRASGVGAEGGTCILVRRGGVEAHRVSIEQSPSWTGILLSGGWLDMNEGHITGGRGGIVLPELARRHAGSAAHGHPVLMLNETVIEGARIGVHAVAGTGSLNPYPRDPYGRRSGSDSAGAHGRSARHEAAPDIVLERTTILNGQRAVVLDGPVRARITDGSLIRGMTRLAIHSVRASVDVTNSYIEYNQGHGIVVYRGSSRPGTDGKRGQSVVRIARNFIRYNGGNGVSFRLDDGDLTVADSGRPGLNEGESVYRRGRGYKGDRRSGDAGLGDCADAAEVRGPVKIQCNDIILNRGYGIVVSERPGNGKILVSQNEIWGNDLGCIDLRRHARRQHGGVHGRLGEQCYCLKRSRRLRHERRSHGATGGRMSQNPKHYEPCRRHRSWSKRGRYHD